MGISRDRYLSKEDIRNLIMACSDDLKPIMKMALMTGMRKREILNLKWDQVDFGHGCIRVLSMKGIHTIPMTKTVRRLLQGLTRNPNIPYVFYDPKTGRPFRDVSRSFASACEKANINDPRFRDLRRTFILYLFSAGHYDLTALEVFGCRNRYAFARICNFSSKYTAKIIAALDKLINV